MMLIGIMVTMLMQDGSIVIVSIFWFGEMVLAVHVLIPAQLLLSAYGIMTMDLVLMIHVLCQWNNL